MALLSGSLKPVKESGVFRRNMLITDLGMVMLLKTLVLRTVLNAGSQAMKAGTRRFFNNFPVRKKPIFKIKLFIRLFALWYNFIRLHQTLKRPTATPIT